MTLARAYRPPAPAPDACGVPVVDIAALRDGSDTLVVSVGDLLARWTGHVYRSTPHRVISASTQERLSLVFAFDPDLQTLIDPRDVVADAAAGEAPILCGESLQWRFGKIFTYRGQSAHFAPPAA